MAHILNGRPFPDKKKYKIPAKSEKRIDQDRVYAKLRAKFLKKNPFCKARLTGCAKVAQDVHHSKGRVGDNYLDEKKFVAVCRNCHTIIESEPVKSKELGLSENRLK